MSGSNIIEDEEVTWVDCKVSKCPIQCGTIDTMREHVESYHGVFPKNNEWKCNHCVKSFHKCGQLKVHNRKRHNNPTTIWHKLRCAKCGIKSNTLNGISTHLQQFHVDVPRNVRFKCVCGKGYVKWQSFQQHNKEQHDGVINQVFKDENVNCESVRINTNDEDVSENPTQDEDIVIPRTETISGSSSSNNVLLPSSIPETTQEELDWISCEKCPFQTTGENEMWYHLHNTHAIGDGNYICEACLHKYRTRDGLHVHYRETNCKPEIKVPPRYKCGDCNMELSSTFILRHISKFHYTKIYSINEKLHCKTCKQIFAGTKQIVKHMKRNPICSKAKGNPSTSTTTKVKSSRESRVNSTGTTITNLIRRAATKRKRERLNEEDVQSTNLSYQNGQNEDDSGKSNTRCNHIRTRENKRRRSHENVTNQMEEKQHGVSNSSDSETITPSVSLLPIEATDKGIRTTPLDDISETNYRDHSITTNIVYEIESSSMEVNVEGENVFNLTYNNVPFLCQVSEIVQETTQFENQLLQCEIVETTNSVIEAAKSVNSPGYCAWMEKLRKLQHFPCGHCICSFQSEKRLVKHCNERHRSKINRRKDCNLCGENYGKSSYRKEDENKQETILSIICKQPNFELAKLSYGQNEKPSVKADKLQMLDQSKPNQSHKEGTDDEAAVSHESCDEIQILPVNVAELRKTLQSKIDETKKEGTDDEAAVSHESCDEIEVITNHDTSDAEPNCITTTLGDQEHNYQCVYCDYESSNKMIYRFHLLQDCVNVKLDFSCYMCHQPQVNAEQYISHLRECRFFSPSKTVECILCFDLIPLHTYIHHFKKELTSSRTCSKYVKSVICYCKKTFHFNEDVVIHLSKCSHHSSQELVGRNGWWSEIDVLHYACPYCGYMNTNKVDVLSHIAQSHHLIKQSGERVTELTNVKCTESFPMLKNLQVGELIFGCLFCDAMFNQASNAKWHCAASIEDNL